MSDTPLPQLEFDEADRLGFKLGDRVRTNTPREPEYHGHEGIIVDLDHHMNDFAVRVHHPHSHSYTAEDPFCTFTYTPSELFHLDQDGYPEPPTVVSSSDEVQAG